LAKLSASLAKQQDDWKVIGSDLIYIPLETIPNDSDELKSNVKGLISDLEVNEDVLHVWTSVDVGTIY